ncbi:MAG: sporulation initiation factor Spo0A C-terminal domain-containing protein [Oscillospiraceae bacterium]|nr:sporulation initiation factor Spo0A C-terminal domain-containing protein [Oscillospiraceae bacterium]MBR5363827.1 sporulation initiation factor Spo0A C-terminal domain-containing protein [Oscillospiraceae bacterium]
MNKQLRIIIGDIGDESAANIAAAFAGEGEWAVTRLQRHDKLTAAVRTEHPDVLVLNLTAETIHVPVLTEELLRHSELVILVLYNRKNDGLARILTQQGVHYVPCTKNITELVSYVYRLSGMREPAQDAAVNRKDPEYAVTHLLHCFGIPTNLRGFHYLRCAIMTAYRQDIPSGCMMNLIYPAVAELLHSTPSRVERSIRHAITQAWENADGRNGWEYGVCDGHRMTNSEFISFAVDWLRTEQQQRLYG